MQTAAQRFLRIPARTDLSRDSLPDWIQGALRDIRPMPLDRKVLADSLDTWMRYWDANIRNSERKR